MQIAFFKGSGKFYDKLIRIFTFGPYSHVELIFSNGLWFSSSSLDNGVRYTVHTNMEDWTIFDINITCEEEVRIKQWCDIQVGAEYDFLGIFRYYIPFCQQSPDKWFCSEICLEALQRIGWFQTGPSWHMGRSPNHLYRLLRDRLSIFSVVGG
jgi:uncharacterized protein YycO